MTIASVRKKICLFFPLSIMVEFFNRCQAEPSRPDREKSNRKRKPEPARVRDCSGKPDPEFTEGHAQHREQHSFIETQNIASIVDFRPTSGFQVILKGICPIESSEYICSRNNRFPNCPKLPAGQNIKPDLA